MRGYHVLTATNGAEAVTSVRSNSGIDMIFMDLKMSGMDGLSAIKEIRKEYTMPIVVVTGWGLEQIKKDAFLLIAIICTSP